MNESSMPRERISFLIFFEEREETEILIARREEYLSGKTEAVAIT